MANFGTAKTFFDKSPQVVVESATETWTVVTTAVGTELSHTLQTDAVQVEVINLDYYDGGALTGRARVAITAAETADAGNYIPLAAGKSVIIDVGANTIVYYKRESAANVSLLFRERRI